MLSVKKVKLHGMTSAQWTTNDKITQYKGLINLYTRDKKIVERDNAIAKKRQIKQLKSVQRKIETNRKTLDNAVKGNKNRLRNTLADHKGLQLRFQESTTDKAIETIYQVNFCQRKQRDLLKYKTDCKSVILKDLKLEHALYEDMLRFQDLTTMPPVEKNAYLLSGKVEDAKLRQEAAIYIRDTYKEIIGIMRKDAIYFEAILTSLKHDGLQQGKCMLSATKLGQIAMEYLDDRRKEFRDLKKLLMLETWNRNKELETVRRNVEENRGKLINLIRRDSDVNLGKVSFDYSDSYIGLEEQVHSINRKLKSLQRAFATSCLEQLYPAVKEQLRQKKRLTQMRQKYETERNDYLRKVALSAATLKDIESKMIHTTNYYNTRKVELGHEITKEVQKTHDIKYRIDCRHGLLAKIRISLKHLQYLSTLLSVGEPVRSCTDIFRAILKPVPPDPIEVDPLKICPELTTKFSKLAHNAPILLQDKLLLEGYLAFEVLLRVKSNPTKDSRQSSQDSIIEAVFTDTSVPTYEDIKKNSAEIVAEGLAAQVYQPPPQPRRRRYKEKT